VILGLDPPPAGANGVGPDPDPGTNGTVFEDEAVISADVAVEGIDDDDDDDDDMGAAGAEDEDTGAPG